MSEAYLAQQPIQIWNPVRGVWEKPMASLLCEHWELFSEAWQTSGMMRNGQVFALPMPAHLTADSEYSSQPQDGILRTPTASQGQGGALGEAEALRRGNTVGIRDQVMDLAAAQGLKVSRDAVNLPTPAVNDMGRGKTIEAWDEWTEKMKSKHGNGNGHGPSLDIEVLRLMPTPTTMDAKATNNLEVTQKFLAQGKQTCLTYEVTLMPTPNTMDHLPARSAEKIAESKERTPGGYANIRETVVNELIPTPTTRDYKDGTAEHERDGVVQTDTVARAIFNSGEVTEVSWGKFEPAIRRWEAVMNRPAPAPTLPDGKDGAHRLSPWFTEWMMGLPDGWICDPEIGLTRNEQLKACGNGVCPQQAELALNILIPDWVIE